MADVKKTILKTSNCNCSKKEQFLLEVSLPLDKAHLQAFAGTGFIEVKSYTNLGILYVEDVNLVAIGPFGSNRLQIKCKNANCNVSLANLENILKNIN